ncbi:MAG TPA: 50S ribosomal protein L18 [bacterium]|nr:50S ribosomal protein L18 [bacterium]HPP29475.1 50S ribosomal protein L18 [bacterium]
MKITKKTRREKRHLRVRKKISGTLEIPRVVVFRSNKHFYVSLVNDEVSPSSVLLTVSSLSPEFKENKTDKLKGYNIEGAKKVGEIFAKKCIEKGITKVVFDRSGYRYGGRVSAFAEAARKGGLKF